MVNAFLQSALGALQATLSVLLVLLYGAASTKYLHFLDEDAVNRMTKLGTNVFLGCLLFTEMGKESKPEQLKEFWILPVFNIALTGLALAYAFVGIKLFKFERWMAPACAFPNMLSLPLLLIESLSSTGVLDQLLMGEDDTVKDALARAKIYFLVNGLSGNIVRFALGPYLLNPSDGDDEEEDEEPRESGNRTGGGRQSERSPLLQNTQPGQTIPSYSNTQGNGDNGYTVVDDGERSLSDEPYKKQAKVHAKRIGYKITDFLNPPLVAALVAILFGLIKPLHKAFFEEGGVFNASLTQSIETLGKLYTGLQMFVLGGKLVSKQASRPRTLPLLYLFLFRFFLVPLASVGAVYLLRSNFPTYVKQDPILDFCISVAFVGPPAITLAALADMSGMDQEEQGMIAAVLLASYLVTPIFALPVSAAVNIISSLYK